jgi:hypothetical protein
MEPGTFLGEPSEVTKPPLQTRGAKQTAALEGTGPESPKEESSQELYPAFSHILKTNRGSQGQMEAPSVTPKGNGLKRRF